MPASVHITTATPPAAAAAAQQQNEQRGNEPRRNPPAFNGPRPPNLNVGPGQRGVSPAPQGQPNQPPPNVER